MSKSNISYLTDVINVYSANCIKVSEGCQNCYAESMMERFGKKFRGEPRWLEHQVKEFTKVAAGAVCGINFLNDTWIESAPIEWIDAIHHLCAQRPDVTFIYTTKRAQRLAAEAVKLPWPDNLWVGVSVETSKYLWRIDALHEVPTPNRWVSFEPLLGPIATYNRHGLSWVVTGGESGETARRMVEDWAWDIGRMAMDRGIPWYHKQGNGRWPDMNFEIKGKEYREFPAGFHRTVTPPEQMNLF